MERITLTIKDVSKKNLILRLLKELKFVRIEEHKPDLRPRTQEGDFRNLFGIWKNRNIELVALRKKAWGRR
ncbi:MAG: hypothetical protein HYS25_05530 [Ignavibacteriales bacterium]|nr:hypothetical protein [Ignavibacteriales bacterium]